VFGRLAAWTVWWAVLFWLWLLFTGDWNRIELIGAACGAAVGATIAELVRSSAGQRIHVPLGPLRAAATMPLKVVADSGIVVYALLRSLAQRRVVRGAFVTRRFDPGARTTPRGEARRAWTTVLETFSPNSYVVDIDVEGETILTHELA